MYKCQIREALVFEIVFQKGRNKKFDESEFDKGPWICIYMYGNAWISMDMLLASKDTMDINGHLWMSMGIHECPLIWMSTNVNRYRLISVYINGYPWISTMIC